MKHAIDAIGIIAITGVIFYFPEIIHFLGNL